MAKGCDDNKCEWFYNRVCTCDGIKPCKPVKVSKTKLKAHWDDISDATSDNGGHWHLRDLQCSNCKAMYNISFAFTYCPDCGARMVR